MMDGAQVGRDVPCRKRRMAASHLKGRCGQGICRKRSENGNGNRFSKFTAGENIAGRLPWMGEVAWWRALPYVTA